MSDLPNDPNGVTWLPAWKRHGYESPEAYEQAQAIWNERLAEWAYSHWPQEKPPPYPADDEDDA